MTPETARRDRFEALVAGLYDPLQRYLRRRVPADDSADLLSEVLLVLWRRLDDIPMEAPLPWAYGVARRTVSNHRRGARRRLRLVDQLEAQPDPNPSLDPADSLVDPELSEALATLPDADREVLRLWAWEQLEPREIARVLGSTPNAVSLRLSRAKRKLADELSRQDGSSGGHLGDRHPEEHLR